MEQLNDKVDGSGGAQGSLPAGEWNQVPSELQNIITQLGQTLSAGDLNQVGKAIAGYVANGTFYTDGGAANAYVLSVVGTKQAATEYTDGFEVNFVAANPNTGASTVNVAGLGVKNIKLENGTDPTAGQITGRTKCIYDASNDWFELQPELSLGVGQIWTNVTGSRAPEVVYTNTTGRPIFITVTTESPPPTTANSGIDIKIDGFTVARTIATVTSAQVEGWQNLSLIIPNGSTYEAILHPGDNIQRWWELR